MTGEEPSLRVLSVAFVDHGGLEPEPSCGTAVGVRARRNQSQSLGMAFRVGDATLQSSGTTTFVDTFPRKVGTHVSSFKCL